MKKDKVTAIVLAGGSGTRMGGECKKQYMLLNGYPILYYSLKAFQDSPVDEILLVTNEESYCREELIEKYHMDKVTKIVPGGEERYESVYNGLLEIEDSSYVLIHDGARPFVTREIILRCIEEVKVHKACVVGMPVKDTVKIVDDKGFASYTPERNYVYLVQTPQAFSYPLILKAYRKVIEEQVPGITDDGMVVEYLQEKKVKLIEGSYQNIKITTPEDYLTAKAFLENKK
ncbi:MAG: 2-C-methyl-D-erythritol 4-phosphate cytidylyltransferase [Lachnospiraceae bacterium]|nr:2-C-methyl-D-erythritol 4-phosphate cytidylyltransferase [Lachnospiraceae bacterium]MDE6980533.1 2-C-methyl-D-erythritol 4-phosphate cytidylyltransferase [Lachnospiraceae bacterium]